MNKTIKGNPKKKPKVAEITPSSRHPYLDEIAGLSRQDMIIYLSKRKFDADRLGGVSDEIMRHVLFCEYLIDDDYGRPH
jgi:hypothetical protein